MTDPAVLVTYVNDPFPPVRAGLSCPDLTFERFERCLDYAVECEWGAGLFA